MLWSAIIWSGTQGPVKRTFWSSSMLGDFAPRSANRKLAGSGDVGRPATASCRRLRVRWGYFNIYPKIRPDGHVAVSSSVYANRVSLARHDVYPQPSGLCRFSGTARGSGRLHTHPTWRPISQYGNLSEFLRKVTNPVYTRLL